MSVLRVKAGVPKPRTNGPERMSSELVGIATENAPINGFGITPISVGGPACDKVTRNSLSVALEVLPMWSLTQTNAPSGPFVAA